MDALIKGFNQQKQQAEARIRKELKQQQKQKTQKQQQKQKTNAKIPKNLNNYGKQLASVSQRGLGNTLRMIPSTANFAKVYMDPFTKYGARLPVLPVYASKMTRNVASGTGVLNATGIGMINAIPENGVTNNFGTVFYSNAPASPPFFTTDSTTYSIGGANMKSSYASGSFFVGSVDTISQRIVGFGIRVRNIGTVLNSAGAVYMAQTNPRVTLDTYGIDDVKKQAGYKEYQFADREWHTITRHICCSSDKEFLQFNSTTSKWVTSPLGDNVNSSNYLGILMQGTPGQPFEWEVVGHYELMGPNLDQVGVVHIDEPGVHNVISQASILRHQDNATKDHLVTKTGTEASSGSLLGFLQKAYSKAEPIISAVSKVASTILPLI
jgi:hypothetical protein